MPREEDENRRMTTLLVLVPHPDDEAYAFGGLMAIAVGAGWRVVVHCASSGEKGKRHDGGDTAASALGPVREDELRASCVLLGAEPPQFWRLPDGGLRRQTGALIARCDEALREVGAQVVVTLGSDGAYGHPDHVALHRAVETVFATTAADSALLFAVFPKGLFLPQYEKCIGMLGVPPDPPVEAIGSARWDWELDVSTAREAKLGALSAHRSQRPAGDARAIFPAGIVDALLAVERYAFARPPDPVQSALLESLRHPMPAPEFAPGTA